MPSSSVVVLSWFWSAKPVPAWCAPLKVSFRGENSTNAHTIVCFSGFSYCFCCLQQVCGGLPDCTCALCTLCFCVSCFPSKRFFTEKPPTHAYQLSCGFTCPMPTWFGVPNSAAVQHAHRVSLVCLVSRVSLGFVSRKTTKAHLSSPFSIRALFCLVCMWHRRGGCKDPDYSAPPLEVSRVPQKDGHTHQETGGKEDPRGNRGCNTCFPVVPPFLQFRIMPGTLNTVFWLGTTS